jgi:dienelactone hydrolase
VIVAVVVRCPAVPFEPIPLDVVGAHDRVPTLLFVPRDAAAHTPLLLFGHGANLSKDDVVMQQIAKTLARWVPAVVAVIDFPAHGERDQGGGEPAVMATMDDPALPAQLADDWNAVIAAARAHTRGRVGYVGFSMGAVHGFSSVAGVPEVEAAAFMVGGFRVGGRGDDIIRAGAERLAGREVLMCNMTRDEHFPIDRALDLFALVPGPKRMHVFEGTHTDLAAEAVRSAADFFARTLAPVTPAAP